MRPAPKLAVATLALATSLSVVPSVAAQPASPAGEQQSQLPSAALINGDLYLRVGESFVRADEGSAIYADKTDGNQGVQRGDVPTAPAALPYLTTQAQETANESPATALFSPFFVLLMTVGALAGGVIAASKAVLPQGKAHFYVKGKKVL